MKRTIVSSDWSQWLTRDPGVWPLCRLFWSARVPQAGDAHDPAQVVAVLTTILEEGTADDWRCIRWDAVRPIWDTLPLDPVYRPFWEAYWKEMDAIDQRSRVLDVEQHLILGVAATVLPAFGFELAGGTALAAGYLGHRLSDDLDLFAGPLATPQWEAAQTALESAWTTGGLPFRTEVSQGRFTRYWVGVRPVKVELAQDSPFHLTASTATVDGMPIRSLPDLAADKTLALFGRATTRDFVDVYLLLQRYELSQLMAWGRAKDPGFSVPWFIRALVQVERVQPERVQLLVPLDWDHLCTTFRQAAIRLDRTARETGPEYEL